MAFGWLKKFAVDKIGLDERVVSGLASRILHISASPISSLITVWCLTKDKQGLFYLFGSLLALRSLFELGAGMSVIQVSAHARLKGSDSEASPLDPAFVVTVNKWMLVVASVFGLVTGLSGLIFLIYQGHGDWQTLSCWCCFLVISVFQFSSEGRWALLEGSGQVVSANRLRMWNTLFQYSIQWTLLFAGAGLFSFVGASLAAYLAQEFNFRRHHQWLYVKMVLQLASRVAHFKNELVTLVKRASQTYLTGYFVFQIQQPICFHYLGADGSAMLGFTHSIGVALIGLPMTWLAMNFPRLTHLVAENDIKSARSLFKARYLQIILLSLSAAVVAWLATMILRQFPQYGDRLMNPLSTLLLYSAYAVQTIALALAFWPRAFKVEPFVRVAYAQMVVTPLLLWFLISHYGLIGIPWAFMGSWLVGLVGISLITKKYWDNPPHFPSVA